MWFNQHKGSCIVKHVCLCLWVVVTVCRVVRKELRLVNTQLCLSHCYKVSCHSVKNSNGQLFSGNSISFWGVVNDVHRIPGHRCLLHDSLPALLFGQTQKVSVLGDSIMILCKKCSSISICSPLLTSDLSVGQCNHSNCWKMNFYHHWSV